MTLKPYFLPFLDCALSNSALRPVAMFFVEFPLLLVRTIGIMIGILSNVKRADKAVIRSWFSFRGYAFPDYKNLIGETLNIVAIFYHGNTFKLSCRLDKVEYCTP